MEDKIYCKECCREISKETSENYKGFCKSCYNERNNTTVETQSNINGYHKISIIYFIIIIISSFIAANNIPSETNSDFNIPIMLGIILIGFISFFLFFMLATIIQELRNIQK